MYADGTPTARGMYKDIAIREIDCTPGHTQSAIGADIFLEVVLDPVGRTAGSRRIIQGCRAEGSNLHDTSQ